MKKLIVALSLGIVSSVSMAAASTVCSAGTATAVPVSTTNFVRSGFTPRCSTNTLVSFDQDTVAAGVGATSSKGNRIFGGHSNGGAVTETGSCAATTCTITEAATAATAKLAASASS